MEREISRKPYVVTGKYRESRKSIYEYSLDTFGYFQAERYLKKINESVDTLPDYYSIYPECRHLETKSRMYRNIILVLIVTKIETYKT